MGSCPLPANLHISDHPVVRDKLCELRATATPTRRFRDVVGDLTRLLFYEASADLATEPAEVEAPLGLARGRRLRGPIVLAPVMRAGLGMAEVLTQMLPDSVVWHLGIRRDEETLNPVEYYDSSPSVCQAQTCLLLDPMLATGGTAAAACRSLKHHGLASIRYVGLIAAPEGVARLHAEHPDVPLFVAALDDGLDERGFILPGLGDAGDRQYGTE
jgi:uracil phosphoribosyltransferase